MLVRNRGYLRRCRSRTLDGSAEGVDNGHEEPAWLTHWRGSQRVRVAWQPRPSVAVSVLGIAARDATNADPRRDSAAVLFRPIRASCILEPGTSLCRRPLWSIGRQRLTISKGLPTCAGARRGVA